MPWTPIGFSQGGEPLVLRHLGEGPNRLLILGGQHGAPEANTIELVQQLTAHFVAHPDELPASVGLDVLAITNPCGCYNPTYLSLNGQQILDDPGTPPVSVYSVAVNLTAGQHYALSISGASSNSSRRAGPSMV